MSDQEQRTNPDEDIADTAENLTNANGVSRTDPTAPEAVTAPPPAGWLPTFEHTATAPPPPVPDPARVVIGSGKL